MFHVSSPGASSRRQTCNAGILGLSNLAFARHPHIKGALNGLVSTLEAIAKGTGPAIGAPLLALSLHARTPVTFFIGLCVVTVLAHSALGLALPTLTSAADKNTSPGVEQNSKRSAARTGDATETDAAAAVVEMPTAAVLTAAQHEQLEGGEAGANREADAPLAALSASSITSATRWTDAPPRLAARRTLLPPSIDRSDDSDELRT
jgi:hypothetical protein